MISRLALVGMVATLGISVPSWPEMQNAMSAFHSWTASQLAAWDCSGPNERHEILTLPIVDQTATVRGRESGSGPGGPRLVFEPIAVEDEVSGVAYELNRLAEGLILSLEAVRARPRERDSGSMSSIAGRGRTEFSPDLSADTLELKLAHEMLRIAENAGTDSQAPGADRLEPAAHPVVTIRPEISTPPEPTRQATEAPIVTDVRVATIGTTFKPASSVVAQRNQIADGNDTFPSEVFADPARYPTFEPIDVGTEIASGTADELNRVSDGLTDDVAVARRVDRPASAPTEGRADLGQAIQLTQEAIHAWMNVLTGPALVQMSSR